MPNRPDNALVHTSSDASDAPYPPAPWQTHGFGVFVPYVVKERDLELPQGMEPIAVAGRCAGVLAYVVYSPPSPLHYSELIWMPCMVKTRSDSGRTYRGYYVSEMYVDDRVTLLAGREIWGLPKTWAQFDVGPGRVGVKADDGTRVELTYRPRALGLPVRSRMSTLQSTPDGVIQFRAQMRGTARPCSVEVGELSSRRSTWQSFQSATRVSGAAVEIRPFDSKMCEPTRL